MLASVRTVGLILDRFASNSGADFVVVKNRFAGPEADDFERYDASKSHRRLLDVGGVEIDMPAMRMRTYVQLDEHNLSFTAATTSERLRIADRSVAFRWIERFDAELGKAGERL